MVCRAFHMRKTYFWKVILSITPSIVIKTWAYSTKIWSYLWRN